MLDPVRVLRLYLAMKLHFTTKKYDIFESKGRVKSTPDALHSNKARYAMVMRVCRQIKTYPSAAEYFMCQHLYHNGTVFDAMSADENFARWEKYKLSSTQIILDDLYEHDAKKIIMGDEPPIFRLVMSEKVRIETATALNKIFSFVDLEKDYSVFNNLAFIISKSTRWNNFNMDKVCKEIDYEAA